MIECASGVLWNKDLFVAHVHASKPCGHDRLLPVYCVILDRCWRVASGWEGSNPLIHSQQLKKTPDTLKDL